MVMPTVEPKEPKDKRLANSLLKKIKEGSQGFQHSFVFMISEEEFHGVATDPELLPYLTRQIQKQRPRATLLFHVHEWQLCFDAAE